MAEATLRVSDLPDGHVVLDIECLDRIYLNGYVPNLQVGGQVVSFMTRHLGYPIPSPAVMEKIGTALRRAVLAFAETDRIPVVRFGKDDRKIDVMRRYVLAQARAGRSGVAAIGVAQEFQNVFLASLRDRNGGVPWYSFAKADRRVTCFYFYLWDEDFGPGFIKVATYFRYPIKVCLLTELPAVGPRVAGQVRVGVVMVPARDRIQRAVTRSHRAGGAPARCPARERRSVRAVPDARCRWPERRSGRRVPA